jgi:hypothetical protein
MDLLIVETEDVSLVVKVTFVFEWMRNGSNEAASSQGLFLATTLYYVPILANWVAVELLVGWPNAFN